MRKRLVPLAVLAAFGIASGVTLLTLIGGDSPAVANYKRVHVGMPVADVQAILGPGVVIPQASVPGIVVAMAPTDETAADESARLAGVSPPTARGYPTRIKPVVEGDYILEWVNDTMGERTLVAFKDGKLCEKNFWDPNHL